jgi:hypothetical protein
MKQVNRIMLMMLLAAAGLRAQTTERAAPLGPRLQTAVQALAAALQGAQPQQWGMNARQRREYAQATPALERNLQEAVPRLLDLYQRQPQNLAAAFRLYRDLQAVAQVAGQAAGLSRHRPGNASGQALRQAAAELQRSLSALGDSIQAGANRLQAELARATAASHHPKPPQRLDIQNANAPPRRHR